MLADEVEPDDLQNVNVCQLQMLIIVLQYENEPLAIISTIDETLVFIDLQHIDDEAVEARVQLHHIALVEEIDEVDDEVGITQVNLVNDVCANDMIDDVVDDDDDELDECEIADHHQAIDEYENVVI